MILKLHDIKMTIRELLQTFYSCVINLLKYKRQMEMCNVARETRVLGQHGSRVFHAAALQSCYTHGKAYGAMQC